MPFRGANANSAPPPTVSVQLDPTAYPFARSVAPKIRDHDDRSDFLAGIDLILAGIKSSRSR
jgi:hypothetical protein